MTDKRETIRLVVAGHVDHGKSTVIGRLLFDTRSLPQGTIDKVRRIARETGKDFEYAYLLDAFEEEQKQGITIDTTQLQFHSGQRDYVIIDAPGHKEFLKNMISGASGAEAAFLVIDAARGVEEQSKRHAYMLSLLGIRQISVIVNKMDLVGYAAGVFQGIRKDMDAFLASSGVEAGNYIPLSALCGENVLEPSPKLPWYDGPTLIGALDRLDKAPGLEGRPLRFPVQDVYKFDDRRIIAGRVESGTLRTGDEIVIHPGGKRTRVLAIAWWAERDRREEASAGESTGVIVADEFFNRRGEVVSHAADGPTTTLSFRASLFWMGRQPLKAGRKYILKIATQKVECEIARIFRVIDASTLANGERDDEVRLNDVAEVAINTLAPVAADPFAVSQATGRFVLVDGYDVVGGGIVSALDAAGESGFSGFVHGELRVACELFEEYYFSVDNRAVNRKPARGVVYGIGDDVPLAGRSYSYPEFLDIIVWRDQAAVKIRGGRVAELLPLAEYRYEGLPLVDGRGFAIRARSREEWRRCREEHLSSAPVDAAALSNQWLDFSAYRLIPFSGDNWVI